MVTTKTPPYQGLNEQLLFEQNLAIKRLKTDKKTLGPTNARRHYLRNNQYLVREDVDRNVFKKTKAEKIKLKALKKISTFMDGTM